MRKYILSGILILFVFACEERKWTNIYDPDSSVDPEEWAPQDLEIEQLSDIILRLRWQQRDPRIEGLRVDRKKGDGEWLINYSELDTTLGFWTDTVSLDSSLYHYRLYAYAGENRSNFLEEAVYPVFPAVEIQSFENLTDGGLKILWNEHSYSGITGYCVERSEDNGPFSEIATVADTFLVDYITKTSSLYRYRVRARTDHNLSGYSQTRSVQRGIVAYNLIWENGFTGSPTSVAISNDNTAVLGADHYTTSTLKVLDLATGNLRWETSLSGTISSAEFTHNSQKVVGGFENKIVVWDAVTGGVEMQMEQSDDIHRVTALDIRSDDSRLIGGYGPYGDGRIRMWDLGSGDSLWDYHLSLQPRALGFADDDRKIIGIAGSAVYGLNATDGSEIFKNLSGTQEIYHLDVSADGQAFLTGINNSVTIYNSADGSELWSQDIIGVQDLQFEYGSSSAILTGIGAAVMRWNTTTNDSVRIGEHNNTVTGLSVSPDNSKVACTSVDNTVRVWESSTKRLIWSQTLPERFYAVQFAPDGSRIAVGCGDHYLRVFQEKYGWYELE